MQRERKTHSVKCSYYFLWEKKKNIKKLFILRIELPVIYIKLQQQKNKLIFKDLFSDAFVPNADEQ